MEKNRNHSFWASRKMSKIHQCFFASANQTIQCWMIVMWWLWMVLILLISFRLRFIRSLNCWIILLGCYCCLPVIVPMHLNCLYFVINCFRGLFPFFIIYCWCMQRTDGRLHHYHHPSPQSVNNNIYDFHFLFSSRFFILFLLAIPILLCRFPIFHSRNFV